MAELKVVEDSDIRNKITKDLEKAGLKLTRFYQVINSLLKLKFDQELENLRDTKHQDFDANLAQLYHGTTADVTQICNEGLDERLSRKGRFGRGIYFSDEPIKCRRYAEGRASNGDAYLLICKVILGDIKEFRDGIEERSLKKEPLKCIMDGKRIFYDSVKGKPLHYTEYVIYEKRRALIEYVAYYERTCTKTIKEQIIGIENISESSDTGSDSESSSDVSDDEESLKLKRKVKESIEKEQRAALEKLAQMKSVLKPHEFDNLVKSYIATYGKTMGELKITSEPPREESSSGDLEFILKQDKVMNFSSITGCSNQSECKTYLENSNYELGDALNAYFDRH